MFPNAKIVSVLCFSYWLECSSFCAGGSVKVWEWELFASKVPIHKLVNSLTFGWMRLACLVFLRKSLLPIWRKKKKNNFTVSCMADIYLLLKWDWCLISYANYDVWTICYFHIKLSVKPFLINKRIIKCVPLKSGWNKTKVRQKKSTQKYGTTKRKYSYYKTYI